MNARWTQLVHYAHERRLRVLEAYAEITADPKDVLEIPVVRKVIPDAISQADLEALEKEKEAAWEKEKKDWFKRAMAEIEQMKQVVIDEVKATMAIAPTVPAKGAIAPGTSLEDLKKMIREELAAEKAAGEQLAFREDPLNPDAGAAPQEGQASAPATLPTPPPIPPAGPLRKGGK